MAVLKHIASKNSNYGESIEYLMFQHNEITGKPVLDEQGRMQLRTEYYMDGINCDPMSFDLECERVNNLYHKNQKYDEIKSHHYIISFDPKDSVENGLTGEKAQALGLEYAKRNFPGHQALVVTHTDGHNESGNIHVHIVINSLRKHNVPKEDFMERDCDSKAGYKHHTTKNPLKHLQKSVMDMCEKEGLHQVDLLSPAAQKITQQEYWAKRRGQDMLDQQNEEMRKEGIQPNTDAFQTQKQYIRNAIDDSLEKSSSIEEFKSMLLEDYQISTTEKRGRLSFHHPDRQKAVTGKSLGSHYTKEYIFQHFGERMPEKEKPDYHRDPIQILYFHSELRLVVDLQKCVKAQQSEAYAHKVKLSNLKQMAQTIIYVQEHQYDSYKMITNQLETISQDLDQAKQTQTALQTQLTNTNQQIHFTGQYFANKSAFTNMIHHPNKKTYRQAHLKEITAYEEARSYLKEQQLLDNMPNLEILKNQKKSLFQENQSIKNQISTLHSQKKELQTIMDNIKMILENPPIVKTKEKEAEL